MPVKNSQENNTPKENCFLRGYWQSEKYFKESIKNLKNHKLKNKFF